MHHPQLRLGAAPPVSSPEPGDDFRNSTWFSDEVLPHAPALRAWLKARFPSLSERDDVVQESLVRAFRSGDRHTVRDAKSYLFRIARNITVDLFRRERSTPLVPASDLERQRVIEDRVGVAEAACASQEFALLCEAIAALPDRCRAVLTLQKFHGLSNQEIADELRISINTVNAQLVIGLARCRQYLLARGVLRGRSP